MMDHSSPPTDGNLRGCHSFMPMHDHRNPMEDSQIQTRHEDHFHVSCAGATRLPDSVAFPSASMFDSGSGQAMIPQIDQQWSVSQVQGSRTDPILGQADYAMVRSSSSGAAVPFDLNSPLHVLPPTAFDASPSAVPVSSGLSDMTDASLALSDLYQYDPGFLPTVGLDGYDGMTGVPTMNAGSMAGSAAGHVSRLWMDISAQGPMESLSLNQGCADQESLHSSQEDMEVSEDGRSNIWTTSTVDSDFQGYSGDQVPALSSYPMSRTGNSSYNYSIFSTDSGDYNGPMSYPSPVMLSSSRRSSVLQMDPFPLDSNPSITGEGLPATYGNGVPPASQAPRSPVRTSQTANAPRAIRMSSRRHSDDLPRMEASLAPQLELDEGSRAMTSTASESGSRRLSHGTRSGSARSDPLYHVGVGPDGLYHCPYGNQGTCLHRPTNLKCNYDKYVDSHIKPYRCLDIACENQQFSSTACLLRHEREAHGMHGHGERPFACVYPDCDRSGANGFPRRWNLGDHMKRVHGHRGEQSYDSLLASSGPPGSVQHHRRRRSSATQGRQRIKPPSNGRARAESSGSGQTRSASHRAHVLKGLRAQEAALQDSYRNYSQSLQASQESLGRDELDFQADALGILQEKIRRMQSSLGDNQRLGSEEGSDLAHPD